VPYAPLIFPNQDSTKFNVSSKNRDFYKCDAAAAAATSKPETALYMYWSVHCNSRDVLLSCIQLWCAVCCMAVHKCYTNNGARASARTIRRGCDAAESTYIGSIISGYHAIPCAVILVCLLAGRSVFFVIRRQTCCCMRAVRPCACYGMSVLRVYVHTKPHHCYMLQVCTRGRYVSDTGT
jgi:hypothetical protein